MNSQLPIEEIRSALCMSLPDITPDSTVRRIPFTYMPKSHARALDPDCILVEGMRGAGKSFWWQALNDDNHRKFVTSAFPETRLPSQVVVKAGYGAQNCESFPDKDIIADLVNRKMSPRHIWRAVLAHCLKFGGSFGASNSWMERTRWVKENPEEYNKFLQEADLRYSSKKTIFILLFDALDLLADTWADIRPLAKALFQFALDLRSYRSIRFKLFVRSDMIDDHEVFNFPESSKLIAKKVSLEWYKVDLYALMFQCIGNNPEHGTQIRKWFQKNYNLEWEQSKVSAWIIPQSLRFEEEKQKEIFHAISGPHMGPGRSGHKRGFPYTWLPNHLGDAREQVSPRSFSAALIHAAENTAPGYEFPLHYNAIKKGVQKASEIRVNEVQEDYPWVGKVMEPIKGLVVPCEKKEIISRWKTRKTIDEIMSKELERLPPRHLESGPNGILQDLEILKLIQELDDGRIQMPDVYRIAFGLGRKGGVKPVK